MKALSVKQPWANLIASGQKTIETRLWGTDYRGQLLIVSSKRPRIEPAGCAVAVAELIECRPMMLADEKAALCEVFENAVAWVFRNVRPLKPFPVNGRLGIFEVDVQEGMFVTAPDRGLFLTLFQELPHSSQIKRRPDPG